MIRSWRNAATRKVLEGGRPNQFRGLDFESALDLLLALNVAASLHDLSPLKSIGLHKLKGDRKHQRSMRLNRQWRLVLELEEVNGKTVVIGSVPVGDGSFSVTVSYAQ